MADGSEVIFFNPTAPEDNWEFMGAVEIPKLEAPKTWSSKEIYQ